jgi:hypothetical protein
MGFNSGLKGLKEKRNILHAIKKQRRLTGLLHIVLELASKLGY